MGHSVAEEEFSSTVEDGSTLPPGSQPLPCSSGVPGYNTRQNFRICSAEICARPRCRGPALFVGNDVADNSDFKRHYKVIDGYQPTATRLGAWLSVQSFSPAL
jgi:hypothetical protein